MLSDQDPTTTRPSRTTGDFLAGRLRHLLSESDQDYIEGLIDDVVDHPGGTCLVERGARIDRSMMLLDGFVFRTTIKNDRRFIVGFHTPGDFFDLHGFALKRLDHNVVAAGPVKVAHVSHRNLQGLLREQPRIARALWFATLLDASIHRKWIQILQQLDAPQRIAHHYAELHTRLALIGRENRRALRTPFTQFDLADMCGVSAVHANRAVGKLRDLGLAEIRRGDLYTDDWDALKSYASFDASYLYGDGPLALKEAMWD